MAYFSLVQILNTLNNPVEVLGQNRTVFLSGFNRYRRISISDFAIAMVNLGRFVNKEIGIIVAVVVSVGRWRWWQWRTGRQRR
jgi:hypothetical protein